MAKRKKADRKKARKADRKKADRKKAKKADRKKAKKADRKKAKKADRKKAKKKKTAVTWLAPHGPRVEVDLTAMHETQAHLDHLQWFADLGIDEAGLAALIGEPNFKNPRDCDKSDPHPSGERVRRFFYVQDKDRQWTRCRAVLVVEQKETSAHPGRISTVTTFPE